MAAGNEGGGAAIGQVIGMTVVALVIGAAAVLARLPAPGSAKSPGSTASPNGPAASSNDRRGSRCRSRCSSRRSSARCSVSSGTSACTSARAATLGPLANPAHYFILVGLFLLFVAGCAAIVLPYEKPGPFAVRITKDWYAPVGGFLMAGCGLYALTGFPLDDVWHRIFGQDVTLWGPTHLMMIGGAGFSTISALLLEYEGERAMGDDKPKEGIFLKCVKYLGFGGIIIGLSVFQIEFDFGVPQFRQVFEPMLIAAAGAFGLVAARMMLGRGAAILAALFAIALRGLVALMVGPVLGAPINWFALYLGAAIVVELLALTPLFKRPIVFGLVSGLLVSTVGLWLESLWIDAVYHYPWPSSMWPEALMMAVPVAILTGACGAMLGMVLTDQRLPARARQHRTGGADRPGHRRGDRQRTALRGAAERHRHNDSDRSTRLRRTSAW